jgi:hypothetical protein
MNKMQVSNDANWMSKWLRHIDYRLISGGIISGHITLLQSCFTTSKIQRSSQEVPSEIWRCWIGAVAYMLIRWIDDSTWVALFIYKETFQSKRGQDFYFRCVVFRRRRWSFLRLQLHYALTQWLFFRWSWLCCLPPIKERWSRVGGVCSCRIEGLGGNRRKL